MPKRAVDMELEEYVIQLLELHVNHEHCQNYPITHYDRCKCSMWKQAVRLANRHKRRGRVPVEGPI